MIRIERNSDWWTAVGSHPAVRLALMGLEPEVVGATAARPDVLPLAAEHGGFLVCKADVMGFVAELHTLFTPEGWGREVVLAGIEGINLVWLAGYQVLTTFEVQSNPRSRPAKTFGFVQAGPWRDSPIGVIRQWVLTREAWEASPASKRRLQRLN